MNTDLTTLEQIEEDLEKKEAQATSQPVDVNSTNETIEEITKPVTPAERRKRISSLIVIAFISLLTGVDYAIIIPTAWGYVNTFVSKDHAGFAVGALLSVYALSGAIAGIILGYLHDIGVSIKRLIILGCVFQIIGNILYLIGFNIYVLVLSRLIAGVGMGLVPPLLAEISRRSTPETRTQLLAKILGCRQIGLFLGPCFTLLFGQVSFSIGKLPVTVNNAPGFLMAILWLLVGIITIFLFFDLPLSIPGPKTIANIIRAYSSRQACSNIVNIFRDSVLVCLLITSFIAYFNQTALETLLTPFTSYQFNWGALEVSILFAGAGVEIGLVYVLIHFITKKFRDQSILLTGYIILSIACLIGVIMIPLAVPGSTKYLPIFLIFVILDVFALPLIVVTTTSLFTIQTNDDQQGISQGIQRGVVNIAAIVGPLYAGILLRNLWIMLIIMFAIVLFATALVVFVYRLFRSRTTDESSALLQPVNNNSSP